METSPELEQTESLAVPFQPLVVIVFGPNTLKIARKWLIERLEGSRIDCGAELIVKKHSSIRTKEVFLYIGAKVDRLLIEAEELKLRKTYKDGSLKELMLEEIHNFIDSGNLDTFLTTSEKQFIVLRAIEGLDALHYDKYIYGYPQQKLSPGQSIIRKYISAKLITNFFPLHEPERLHMLKTEWFSTVKYLYTNQPIDKIEQYFGVKIALYFSFLSAYIISLLAPAIFGVIVNFSPWNKSYNEIAFAIFNMVWSTVFLESWKRRSNSLCYKWGTYDSSKDFYYGYEEPRPDFYGIAGRDPITGEEDVVYPEWKRIAKYYLVTVPIVIFCITVEIFAMLGFFYFRDWWLQINQPVNRVLELLPSFGYNSVFISVFSTISKKVAEKLTKFENHRLQSAFDSHLTLKIFLFEFFNKFMGLFYVAFYLQDRALLKEFLSVGVICRYLNLSIWKEFITFVFMAQRQTKVGFKKERGPLSWIPWLSYYFDGPDSSQTEFLSPPSMTSIHSVDYIYQRQAALEGEMERHPCYLYDITMFPTRKGLIHGFFSLDKRDGVNEYLTLITQFCYLYMFSSVNPLAAFYGLTNNVIQLYVEGVNLCDGFQRPFITYTNGIGIWQRAFEAVGFISVLTNCALIGMNPGMKKFLPSDISAVNTVLIFTGFEHLVLAIKASVTILVPKLPMWIRQHIAEKNYLSYKTLLSRRRSESERKKTAFQSSINPIPENPEKKIYGSESLKKTN